MARLGRAQPFKPVVKSPYPFAPNIQFNVAGNSGDVAAASSYSGAAIWMGNNRALAVDVSMLGPGVTVTAMTYGGANCTLIGVKATVTSFGRVESWLIKQSDSSAPGAGSNTLSVTLSGSIEFTVEWVAYTAVHQSSATEGFNSAQATNAGSATDASVSVTSIADNTWIHGAVVANDTSITANQTSRNNISGTLGSGGNEDTGPVTPAGATTISYSGMGVTTTWAIDGYALRPITAGSSSYTLVCSSGTFTLTGVAANFVHNYTLTAARGTFTVTGNTVNFIHNYTLTSAKGTFVLTGIAAGLVHNALLTASAGTFTVTGNAVNLYDGHTMTAAVGVFTLSGKAVVFTKISLLTANKGTFVLSGNNASLVYSGGPAPGTGGQIGNGFIVNMGRITLR